MLDVRNLEIRKNHPHGYFDYLLFVDIDTVRGRFDVQTRQSIRNF